jgi:Fur family ferric uptake transcriptional regulator
VHIEAEELIGALRRSGLRITKARRAVCEVLAEAHLDHLTAAALLERVNQRVGGNVVASTIYRSIDALEEQGLLHHIHLGHGPGVVHLNDDPIHDHLAHHHLVCENCGRTVDVELAAVSEAMGELAKENDFVMGSVHFALVGRCLDCAS